MLLTPHFLAGAAVASFIPNPALGLAAAFASHFLLDAVPHWHYFLEADIKGSLGARDLRRLAVILTVIVFDLMAGAFLLWLLRPRSWLLLTAGLLAVFPDSLTFFAWLFPKNTLLAASRAFHVAIHASPQNAPPLPLGIPLQLAIILISSSIFIL